MIPGPCIVCGDTNYNLSCGGPSICPKCDCGHFDAVTVIKQAKVIEQLRADLAQALSQVESAAVCDQIMGQIEERFPNWKYYRDLIDCIDVTMHDLRKEAGR